MTAWSEELRAYLAPDETVVAGESGTLLHDSHRSAGVVGVTDRRLLFVSDDEFVDVAHDAVSSIRSQPRRDFTVRGMGPALVTVLGAGVAVSAVVGVLVLGPSLQAFVLTLATVGGVAAAERLRRHGTETEWPTPDARAAVSNVLDDVDVLGGPLAILRRRLAEAGDGDRDLLVLGIASIALTALIGLIAATQSLLVVPLSLVAVGGVGLAEYGYRRHRLRARDVRREERRPGREVSVHLVDGRVVHFQVDPDGRFDRDLSAAVRGSASPTATAEPSRP